MINKIYATIMIETLMLTTILLNLGVSLKKIAVNASNKVIVQSEIYSNAIDCAFKGIPVEKCMIINNSTHNNHDIMSELKKKKLYKKNPKNDFNQEIREILNSINKTINETKNLLK